MQETENAVKLQVVLRIEDGNGFSFVENNARICLVANLNGIFVETTPVRPFNPIKFNTELVWDVERKSLRELKLNNVPIKLECFSILNEERTRLGYIMLSLKSAPTISPNASYIERKTWQRLLGVNLNHRAFQPEILLDLFVEDVENNLEIPMSKTRDMNMSVEFEELSNKNINPILKNEKGYIQIGPEEICTDIYLIHIFLAAPTNLHVIINDDNNKSTKENFSLNYNVCGVDIHSKEFNIGENGVCDFTEKTVLRVRSNLKFLKRYFNQAEDINIHLFYGNTLIAQCRASVCNIITADDLQDFIFTNKKNYYTVCKCGISYFSTRKGNEIKEHREVYLKTGLSVKYLHPECSAKYKQYANEISGAHYNMDNMQSTIDQISMQQLENIVNKLSSEKNQNEIDQLLQKHIAATNINMELLDKTYTPLIPENQSLQSSASNKLETITEESSSNTPNANLVVKRGGGDKVEEKKSNEQISMKIVEELEDWKEKQQEMFLSEESDNQLLYSSRIFLQKQIWYAKLLKVFIKTNSEIIDMYQEFVNFLRVPISDRILSVVRETYKICCTGTENCQLLWASGLMCLLNFNYWTSSDGDFLIFLLLQLKKKEKKHLAHLSSEWYKKRTDIENQLKKKIEHSRSLAVALEKANDDAKTAGMKNIDTEKQLIKAKEDLERQYNLQYLDLKEAARRLEDDLNHQLGKSNLIKTELTEKIQALQNENKRLQDIITKQQEEYEAIKQSSLNKEQTTTLVHQLKTTYEKLLEAQKSKAFFKDQWARALREVHRIKSDQQKNINVQIKRNKAIDLQTIIDEQESARFDNQELQNITMRLQSLSTASSMHSSHSGDTKDCQHLNGQNNNLTSLLNGMDYFRTGFSSRSSTNTDDSDSDNIEARQLLKNYEIHQIESEDD